jgi:light-regulated signal transduction histidine kinase (bacteriophytochrome)
MPAKRELKLVPLDMDTLVREAWAGIDGASAVDLSLASLPAARGDRTMVRRVWTRLLTNAVRYCAEGDKPRIEVTGREGADHAFYGVRDNGADFELGFSGKLSYFLERIEENYPGTGAGLAVVQRIVTRHGGNAWVEARHGQGSFFQFSLPLREQPIGPRQ